MISHLFDAGPPPSSNPDNGQGSRGNAPGQAAGTPPADGTGTPTPTQGKTPPKGGNDGGGGSL